MAGGSRRRYSLDDYFGVGQPRDPPRVRERRDPRDGGRVGRHNHIAANIETYLARLSAGGSARRSRAISGWRVRRSVGFMAPRSATYPTAVTRCSARALRSGAVDDAVHLVTAEGEGAEVFLTFNVEDFTRLAEPGGPRIVAPPDPPGMPSPPDRAARDRPA